MPLLNKQKLLSKVVKFGDELAGVSARRYKSDVESLKRFKKVGPRGVPEATINRAQRLYDVARAKSTRTRVKTALGTGVGVTTGFLGLHKYHQHKDEKILARINSMYYNNNTPGEGA
jgi:hypothetical protein